LPPIPPLWGEAVEAGGTTVPTEGAAVDVDGSMVVEEDVEDAAATDTTAD
jgi:hypothetical protein